jgi:hypothetical protein
MPNVDHAPRPLVRTPSFFPLRMAAVGLMAASLSGCTISYGGASGDTFGGSDGTAGGPAPIACLRAPDKGALNPRTLSPDEQTRADEVCQYQVDLYQQLGWDIQYTVQMPSGDIYDLFEPAIMPGSDELPPPPLLPEELQLPPGFELAKLELSMYPDLAWPSWLMPKVRPNFSLYISGLSGAISLDDFLKNYQALGTPTGGGRLYAGISSTNDAKNNPTYNMGASASVMPFTGPIESGTLSVLEMVVGCRNLVDNKMLQMVGVAASRDYMNIGFANFGDPVLRLQVEFLTNTEELTGPGKGGWEGTVTHDFIPNKASPFAPGMALIPSTVGGFPVESFFSIRFLNGNWWIGWNGIWLGHYEGKLFNGELSEHACEALWYGEVYDPIFIPRPDPNKQQWTKTDMGSGRFAQDGLGNAAYFRNPSYLDTSVVPQRRWPDNGGTVSPYNDKCYSSSGLVKGLTPFDWMLYIGGPGGDQQDCKGPLP